MKSISAVVFAISPLPDLIFFKALKHRLMISNAILVKWLLTTEATNNPDIKSHSYKNPCQSNSSDYCGMVWDTHTAKDAFQRVMVQHQTDQ